MHKLWIGLQAFSVCLFFVAPLTIGQAIRSPHDRAKNYCARFCGKGAMIVGNKNPSAG